VIDDAFDVSNTRGMLRPDVFQRLLVDVTGVLFTIAWYLFDVKQALMLRKLEKEGVESRSSLHELRVFATDAREGHV